jgi:hypothetical protein
MLPSHRGHHPGTPASCVPVRDRAVEHVPESRLFTSVEMDGGSHPRSSVDVYLEVGALGRGSRYFEPVECELQSTGWAGANEI